MDINEISVTADEDGANAVDLLAGASTYSKVKIKRAMTSGAVWVKQNNKTKRLRRAKAKLQKGDQVFLYYDEKVLNTEVVAPTLISEEKSFSVWYKPSGLLSSGSKFGDHCAINRWIEMNKKPQQSVFIVHRLDRFATGLIVLAHTKSAAAALSEQFKNRDVNKIYKVIANGILEEDCQIDLSLDGKESLSIVKLLEKDPEKNQCLLSVDIKTGRKHQIRRHLSHIGHPVVGDRQYGDDTKNELKLCACELSFNHPKTGQRMNYVLDQALQPKLF